MTGRLAALTVTVAMALGAQGCDRGAEDGAETPAAEVIGRTGNAAIRFAAPAGRGVALGPMDVTTTPAAPSPIPIPYPNTAPAETTSDGSGKTSNTSSNDTSNDSTNTESTSDEPAGEDPAPTED